MIKTAVILTVFNRKEVTLKGLRSLYKAIAFLGDGYSFDIYMTDDGCTDGTAEAVSREYPDIHIVKGDGNLYWSGGMRKAWQVAIDSGIKYDYYLWFNDDADVYEDALVTMFKSSSEAGENAIITGAFCDDKGNVSYGGKTKDDFLVTPNGRIQQIVRMNGNLVLIPFNIYTVIGIIDKIYKHSFGDYDYGFRAQKKGKSVYLTPKYVGTTQRHDVIERPYFKRNNSICNRWKMLYAPKEAPIAACIFELKYSGIFKAIKTFIWLHYYTIFPKFD